jgi:sugar lactone lactonase YvrE
MTTLVEVLFSGERSGRLLAHDPSKNSTRTILGGLSFANGVAVSPDGSFVAVAETMKSRIWRVWLTGPKAGSSEIWISNLPGYPDNLSSDGKHLYVALGLLRNSVSEFIYSNVWARTVLPRSAFLPTVSF